MGYANAGSPMIEAQEEFIGELTVDKKLLKRKRKVFGLEVRGDSMNRYQLNGVNMRSGNFAIIEKDTQIKPGEAVLAVINGGGDD